MSPRTAWDKKNEYVPSPKRISAGKANEAMPMVNKRMIITAEDHIHHCLRSRRCKPSRISVDCASQASEDVACGSFACTPSVCVLEPSKESFPMFMKFEHGRGESRIVLGGIVFRCATVLEARA